MTYNPSHKLEENIAALRIALGYTKGTAISEEQLAVLKKYNGFGGIKAVLYGDGSKDDWLKHGAAAADMKLYEAVQELYTLISNHHSPAEYGAVNGSLKASVLTAFFTPEVVPRVLFGVLKQQGLQPRRIYEPSAGAGIFITEAVQQLGHISEITAAEKDILTVKVLTAVASTLPVKATVHASPFEQTPSKENESADLVASNIPFGNFSVYDRDYPEAYLSGRIHNYFFAKGLDKLADGGILAYITTDGFLNSPGNRQAREYLFHQADFISLAVMPDNLMLETGGTAAPNHLLIVQKHTGKEKVSGEEQLLAGTVEKPSELGSFNLNAYIEKYPACIIGDQIAAGTNQYGKAHLKVWQSGGDINQVEEALQQRLSRDISLRADKERFIQAIPDIEDIAPAPKQDRPRLTYLPMPEDKTETATAAQLGLFDQTPQQSIGRASAYLADRDKQVIRQNTARISAVIKTTDKTEHEAIVLLTAKAKGSNKYLSKLYANLQEIDCPNQWMNGQALAIALEKLSSMLQQYGHDYYYEGDPTFKEGFALQRGQQPLLKGLPSFYREDALYIHNGKAGVLKELDTEEGTARFEPFVAHQDIPFFEKYIAVRDSYFRLFESEQQKEEESPDLREALNNRYREFTGSYGLLNLSGNKHLILNDRAFGFILLSSVERKEDRGYVPADILKARLVTKKEACHTADCKEALAYCLNEKGIVDLQRIGEITGKDPRQVIEELAGHIYYDPSVKDWQTADRYLSGNVLEKLRFIEPLVAAQPDNADMGRSYEAVKKVQPKKIPFELLDFNFGERWIPAEYYDRFASQLFELDAKVYYLPGTDSFKVNVKGGNALLDTEYAIEPKSGRKMYGDTLMEHALENTSPFFTYEVEMPDGKAIRKPDNEATQLAFSKIESIRQAFINWLKELPEEDKRKIEDTYHEKYNCHVLGTYDGSHLVFPGLDLDRLGIKELYPSQKDAAWRIIQNMGSLIDHEVGLGKTLTMIIAAYEMKRMGIIQKPMILGIKQNVQEIAETFRLAYPHAKLLYPGHEAFTPSARKRIFHEIKNNNWDCIILSHEQFAAIEQSPEIQRDIIAEELDNLNRDLDTLKSLTDGKVSKAELKGMEARRINLEAKLSALQDRIAARKDQDTDFKTMGIDKLFVDESHKFKNLLFTTRHNRVAGLGNQQGSQRALNMLFAVRTLQQKYDADKGVTFLTGTPVSNSLTELYLIFKYLRPQELERLNISHFDGWAAVYARKTVDFEFSVTNEIIAKERFRHFIKVPELALFYNEITDYKTAKHIHQDRPELEEILVNIPPTEAQQAFTSQLIAFAKTGDGRLVGLPPLSDSEDRARMLIATNLAKKMSVDMRLVNPYRYEDDPANKISTCAEKFAAIYYGGNGHQVTQMVFSDIGTPKPGAFNVYDALKDKLVNQYGIPAQEITFIHQWQGTKKRKELFRKMNSGEIRGLFGSTEMAGTGLNVQRRLVAEHHLDIPWTPKDLEQRYGRMARPGNAIAKEFYDNKVTAYLYATERSLDNYKFNLLKNKQAFISQMKNNQLQVRTLDEGAMDEKSGMNFSEYIAILSGDTSLLEKSKLEKKVTAMESLKAVFYRQVANAKWELQLKQEEKGKAGQTLENLKKDAALYNSRLQHTKEGIKANPIRIDKLQSSDPGMAGNYILQLFNKWQPQAGEADHLRIGSIYGFEAMILHKKEWTVINKQYQSLEYNRLYIQSPHGSIKYTYSRGSPNENPKLAARYFLEALDRVNSLVIQYAGTVKKLEQDIRQLEGMTLKKFDKEDQLSAMKEELAGLERKISLSIWQKDLDKQSEQPPDAVIEEEIIDKEIDIEQESYVYSVKR